MMRPCQPIEPSCKPRRGAPPLRHGLRSAALTLSLVLGSALAASAAGTAAGTVISNSAKVNYLMKGNSFSQPSNTARFMVDDKVAFTLTAADSSEVSITPGARAYLTYYLTNTGNGAHDFTLSAAAVAGATLTPKAGPQLFADPAGTNPLPVDANAGGLPYLANLAPDESRALYLYISAPADLGDAQRIDYLLTAEAYQPGNLGVVKPPVKSAAVASGDAAVNKNSHLTSQYVVLADGHGSADAERDGRYSVQAKDGAGAGVGFVARSAVVNIVKMQTVMDRTGGSQPAAGSTIRYTLEVTASGTGTALGVVIRDPIPQYTSYLPGTLRLNGAPLSDPLDGDAGDAGGTTPGSVTVKLGDLSSRTPAQSIQFDVRID